MRKLTLLILSMVLAACAHTGRPTPDQEFEAHRVDVKQQRESGSITMVREQELLRERYWQLYGKDADSAGHFAFTIALSRSVEAGEFPANEAQAMIAAREQEMFALKMASRQTASSYEYPEN